MLKIKSMLLAIGGTIIAILGVFWYGLSRGKSQKEAEIVKEGVDDALKTKKREDARRNDSIDNVVKRMRKYSGQ